MNTAQYIMGIVASVLTLVLVIELLRRRRLRERHAIWWLIAGLIALFISIFPQSLVWMAYSLGFAVPINLAFFASLILLFLVALQHSAELTKVESHNRILAEKIALLDMRVRELEKPTGSMKTRATHRSSTKARPSAR